MRFALPTLLLLAACHDHHARYAAPPAVDLPFQPGRETNESCVHCHGPMDAPTMHADARVKIGCTDCHGGDATQYEKEKSHPRPHHPDLWPSSANPERLYAGLNKEDPAWIRFVNPGDLRVAGITCGQCHPSEVRRVRKSMMAHGAMLWGAALYNNGIVPFKNPRFGEAYAPNGIALRLRTTDRPVDPARGQLGLAPVLELLQQDPTAEDAVRRLVRVVEEHRGDGPPTDDLTLLAIKRDPVPAEVLV